MVRQRLWPLRPYRARRRLFVFRLLLPAPSRLRRRPCDLLSGRRVKTIFSSGPAPQSPGPAASSGLFGSILNLARRDIDDQLAELDRVAGSFEALRCHFASTPQGIHKNLMPGEPLFGLAIAKPAGIESTWVL